MTEKKVRLRSARVLAPGLVLLFVALVVPATRVVSIGVAYKTKMLCSEVYLARRNPHAVLAGLESDDLAILRYVTVATDNATRTASGSVLGLMPHRAVYRDHLGCVLDPDTSTQGIGATASDPGQVAGAAGPRVTWEPVVSSPGHPGYRQLEAAVDRAFAEPDPLRPRRTRAVVVVHKGRLAAERYATGFDPGTPMIGWSMTKSVMNALVGIVVGEGRLSLNDPAPIPEWLAAGDARGRITLDHLLRMSSGLTFDEDMVNPLADVTQMLLRAPDMSAYAAARPMGASPGTRWQYSSGTSNIIARVIRNALSNDREYWTLPRRALFDPLGMTSAVIETDASGTFVGSSYMYASARDWARFGMLYLQNGRWGRQRILPEGWVAYTRSPSPADPRRHYGAHFWLDVPDEYRGSGGELPPGTFHAAGHGAQFVTIVPSHDAVIVRLGVTRYTDAWDHVAFVRDLLAALESSGG